MKRGKNLTVFFGAVVLLCALSGGGYASVVHVASDGSGGYPTLQAAIDAVDHGSTVIVEPGIYTGDGNHDIDFRGKAITVQSVDPNDPSVVAGTIIDVQGTVDDPRYGFIFASGEGAASVLDGLTITNSIATDPASSGIHCCESSPVVRHCVIRNMHSYNSGDLPGYWEMGSAVEVVNGDITLEDCTLTENVGSGNPDTSPWPVIGSRTRITGAGVSLLTGSATLLRCTLSNNYCWWGAAVYNAFGMAILTDCHILRNSAHEHGALLNHGTTVLTDCLFAGIVSVVTSIR